MNERIEAAYPVIAQMMVNRLPDDFEEAFLRIEMIDDVWSVGMFYRGKNEIYRYINEGLETIAGKFRELRNLFKAENQEPFTTSTFWLTKSGKFSIDFGYEDVSDFGMAPKRREIWIKKYLGSNPKIDWM